MIPWCAQAPQDSCAGDQPLFAGATRARMTLEWVFRRLVRCQIRRHGEVKGAQRQDIERGGPMREAISVGSLSSLNLCGDFCGVRFGTAHFLVALQHWVIEYQHWQVGNH